MKNIRIVIQYEGTRYQGWQKQESTQNTLQGKFEAILTKMCGKKVEVHASGRTDAGVHAYGQVAHFHIDSDRTAEDIMNYLNTYLPEDVAVTEAKEVNERFHSRLAAKQKIYRYRVLNSSVVQVFERRYQYQVPMPLQLEAMRKAAEYVIGTHDFKAFTSNRRTKKSTVRSIHSITIEKTGDEICFWYCGNGFLYHMVRILTGTLLEIGMGEKSVESMKEILDKGLRENAGALAPAHGLALMKVEY